MKSFSSNLGRGSWHLHDHVTVGAPHSPHNCEVGGNQLNSSSAWCINETVVNISFIIVRIIILSFYQYSY